MKHYPASRGYIFALWAGVRKVASTDNRSIFYHTCAKFVTRFASKINRQACSQMARVSGKELRQVWSTAQYSRKTLARLMQCSKPVKNRKKTVFLFIRPDFWTDLNGCRQRLLFARQLIHRKCIASARRVTKHGNHSGDKAFKHSLVDVDGVGLDEMTTGKVKRKYIEKKKQPYLQKTCILLD